MKETIEIRWHGRAGQGVVTAAVTLADALSAEKDIFVQAFPEFGAESVWLQIPLYSVLWISAAVQKKTHFS